MNQSAIKRIEAILDRYCFGYHLFLEDHRSESVYESGDRRPYPIASCFKFAVARAAFRKLEAEEIPSSTKLKMKLGGQFSGASILSNLSGKGVELEVQQFVELMISTSDGLATDQLIEWVGLQQVNQSLTEFAPASALPVNLDQMVRGVWSLSDIERVKHEAFSKQHSLMKKRIQQSPRLPTALMDGNSHRSLVKLSEA